MNTTATPATKPLAEGKLLSLHVGKIQQMLVPDNARIDPLHPFWTSAIFKSPVDGPLHISSAGIDGDEQADLDNHGGPDNVVLAYDAAHYPDWRRTLSLPDLPYGSFGENFTVQGFSDLTVCIADIWSVGDDPSGGNSLLLQVTQARQPCFKLARRLQRPDIVKRVVQSSRGGWYLRVLRPGPARAGMTIRLLERKYPQWTAAIAVQTMYNRRINLAYAHTLAQLPELSTRWKTELLESTSGADQQQQSQQQ